MHTLGRDGHGLQVAVPNALAFHFIVFTKGFMNEATFVGGEGACSQDSMFFHRTQGKLSGMVLKLFLAFSQIAVHVYQYVSWLIKSVRKDSSEKVLDRAKGLSVVSNEQPPIAFRGDVQADILPLVQGFYTGFDTDPIHDPLEIAGRP